MMDRIGGEAMRRTSTVIEFVGPSGSGKTTIARAVMDLPDAPSWGRRGLAPHPRRGRLSSTFRLVPAIVFIPSIAARLVIDRPARDVCRRLGGRDVWSVLFNAARNRWLAALGREYLQDQGLVHGLAHRTRRWPEEERPEALAAIYAALGAASAPSLIVHFDIAPETAIRRSKMSNPLHHELVEANIILVAIEQSVFAAQRALGVSVVRTDNSGSISSTAHELVPLLSGTSTTDS
jgi:hypothetical protein